MKDNLSERSKQENYCVLEKRKTLTIQFKYKILFLLEVNEGIHSE